MNRYRRAFTVVETLITLAIVFLLAALWLPWFLNHRQQPHPAPLAEATVTNFSRLVETNWGKFYPATNTVQWEFGYFVAGKTDQDYFSGNVPHLIPTGYPEYEIGLRSDGVVVWRRKP